MEPAPEILVKGVLGVADMHLAELNPHVDVIWKTIFSMELASHGMKQALPPGASEDSWCSAPSRGWLARSCIGAVFLLLPAATKNAQILNSIDLCPVTSLKRSQ